MARLLNATYNLSTRYLICNIPDNTMEVVGKIKMTFGKHTMVEDWERRTVKYRPWGKCHQPNIRTGIAKKVALLRLRKMGKEGTESGSSSDLGTWVNLGEGCGYPPAALTSTNYSQTSDEEGGEEPEVSFDAHPQYDCNDSTHESTPEDEAPTIEKLKINEGPYCPVCTPVGHRCICKDEVSDLDDMIDVNKLMPQAKIERSWFYPEETRKTPNGSIMTNSP